MLSAGIARAAFLALPPRLPWLLVCSRAVLFVTAKRLILLVPGEGFEPPTCGLQNRCSTAELTRQINGLQDRS